MKYLASFHTTLKISRYLFRVLALMLWILGALISVFYFSKVLDDKESALRQEYNLSFDQAQEYIRRSSETIRELRYVALNHINVAPSRAGKTANSSVRTPLLSLYSLSPGADCQAIYQAKRNPLGAVSAFFTDWQDNFSTVYDLNRVFFVDADWQCMMDFGIRNPSLDRDNLLKNLQERFVDKKRAMPGEWRDETLYWITPASDADIGYLYAITPIYKGDKLETIMGIEQTIRLDDFVASGKFTTGAKLLDQYNQPLLQFTDKERAASSLATTYPSERNYFGYVNGYDEIILKKALPPTTFNIVYFMPFSMLLSQLNSLIINLVLLNAMSAVVLFILAWVFERKMFLPAQTNAFQLEENEQFNRKIVASAPIGICILRIRDGTNLLSNELAHNYLGVLTHEDRIKITRIICEQQSKYVDVVTSRNHHLQISFVHSRYRNENVAICVLSDVSARVKMEESLQEVANAAEQASQSKSMFLATVSHELRTPLYGIIGNLDLLQTKTLSKDANRLVAAMQNSSALLLKIISDILDFSKIESEQLKIEPRVFTPREVISHITSNYLPLVVKKHLTLYCYIDPNVPASLCGDPVRLQQVLSNLVSNAIKFTDTGCIVFHVSRSDSYLEFWVRDTGVGIHPREAMKLFDPFFQAGSGVQGHFQGTGLGLAICEKLVNLMDGDMTLLSEPGLGSQFGLRIPLYQVRDEAPLIEALTKRTCWLVIRNANLEAYILNLLGLRGIPVHIHTGQPTAPEDMVISDHELTMSLATRASVLISGTHIGTAQEIQPGQWVMSTASPLDLPVLLQRIWCGEEQDTLPVVPSLTAYDPNENSDILILVVDDHPINRRLLADQLGSLGYQVITANDGVDALNTLSRKVADIVLTDVNMPNMDGYTLTRTLRDRAWRAPVIGVTANALAEERQRCLQAGMDNCLSKPVTLDVLQQSLAYYSLQVRAQRDNDNLSVE